jgi:hypothetical protein
VIVALKGETGKSERKKELILRIGSETDAKKCKNRNSIHICV